MSLFCRTQRKIFWREFVTRLFWGTIDFHSRKKKYYGCQWCPRTALFPTFLRISSFVFSRTKAFIQVWNYLRVSKWWQNFHFWVNYPFKSTEGQRTIAHSLCRLSRGTKRLPIRKRADGSRKHYSPPAQSVTWKVHAHEVSTTSSKLILYCNVAKHCLLSHERATYSFPLGIIFHCSLCTTKL